MLAEKNRLAPFTFRNCTPRIRRVSASSPGVGVGESTWCWYQIGIRGPVGHSPTPPRERRILSPLARSAGSGAQVRASLRIALCRPFHGHFSRFSSLSPSVTGGRQTTAFWSTCWSTGVVGVVRNRALSYRSSCDGEERQSVRSCVGSSRRLRANSAQLDRKSPAARGALGNRRSQHSPARVQVQLDAFSRGSAYRQPAVAVRDRIRRSVRRQASPNRVLGSNGSRTDAPPLGLAALRPECVA